MSLLSCVKRGGYKKVIFNIILSIDRLSAVPSVSGVFFAKIRIIDSIGTPLYSLHKPLIDHTVEWQSNHTIICKIIIDPSSNTLDSKFLKITIKQETNGGKSSKSFGYVIVNVAPFANNGSKDCNRRYILASKNKNVRQGNSLLEISIKMCQTFGDPCFRVPEEDFSNCLSHEESSMKNTTSHHSIKLLLTSDDNNDEPDEYSNDRLVHGHNCDNLVVPPQMLIKGHRRITSANTPSWMLPRNSGPTFSDDMMVSDSFHKRYHSSINCFEESSPTKLMPKTELCSFMNKQDLISSTRGSRADIVDNVLKNCLETSSQVLN